MKGYHQKGITRLIVIGLFLFISLFGSAVTGSFQTASAQTNFPTFPMLFAGTVKITSSTRSIDAPIGTVVSAKAGGVTVGSITVTEEGKYGSPPFSFLLAQGNLVSGIEFYVSDVKTTRQPLSYDEGAPPNTNFPLTVEDNQPPVITGMQPADGFSTTTTSITISASYSDVLSGVDASSISLQVDNISVTPTIMTASNLYHSADYSTGFHTVTLYVSDKLGNISSQTWTFTITNPVVILPPLQPSSPVLPPAQIATPVPTQAPVTPAPTPIIPVPTPTTPIIVTPPSPVEVLKNTIESQPPAQAVNVLAQASITQAVQSLQQVSVEKASLVIAELPTPRATEIINTMVIDKAAEVVDKLPTAKAADIVTLVTATRAVEITEKVAVTKAARIMEQITADKTAQIIGQVSSVKAGDILSSMAADKAGQAMDKLVAAKLEQILPAMSAKALQERLPEVSPDRQYEIKPQTLFQLLPQAPTEQLIKETPPVPGKDMEKPEQVSSTATSATYNVSQTRSGEWATLVGTPAPINSILARFKESFSNLQVTIAELASKPTEIKVEPSGQKVSSYISIELPQTATKAVEVGYVRFQVGKNWLKANNIHKWSVTLSRYDSELDTWMALPTKRIDEDATNVYYSASTPRFSVFAISGSPDVPAPEFRISNISISPSPAVAGQPVKVTSEVTNLSNAVRSFAIPLWINSTVESSQIATLAAGGKTEVSYTIYRGAGSYELRVERQMIILQVVLPTPVPTPVLTPTPPTSTPAQTPAPTPSPTLAPTPTPTITPLSTIAPAPIVTPPSTSPSAGVPSWLVMIGGMIIGVVIAGVVMLVLLRRKRGQGETEEQSK